VRESIVHGAWCSLHAAEITARASEEPVTAPVSTSKRELDSI